MTDPYEDQLKAARYKAERDQLRQELARLRGEATTMSAYDLLPEEDRKAMRWVRENGGLERIKVQRRESMPRAAYERKKAGFLGHIAECERALGRRRDAITRLANENDALRLECAQMRPRLMPEGCEWPMVKRPAVSAADGDGCCEPGTYRCQKVAFTCDSCGHTVFVDKCMVDEVRHLRAKGIRTLNCCCGHGGKAEPFIIVNEGDECRMLDMGYERHVNEYGVTCFTPKSSCPPKVIAADGELLEAGQTVYDVDAETDTPLTVVEVSSDLVRCEYTWKNGKTYRPCYPPSVLTHTKPEIDSWERIEEDARGLDSGVDRGLLTHTHEDIVRRCKALAGVTE